MERRILTVIKYDHTHDNQEDAENALRAMANQKYPKLTWDIRSTDTGCLHLYQEPPEDRDEDHRPPEDMTDIELKVEKVSVWMGGPVSQVELQPVSVHRSW